jgi:hypothetical protein
VSEDLFSVLLRFHREVAMPEVREAIRTEVRAEVSALRNDMLTHFDSIYHRFERELESSAS